MKKIKLLLMLAAMSISIAMQAMQVYVNIPGQDQQRLEMEPSDSFAMLKAKLEDKTGIDPNNQSLFFNGLLLLDGEELWQRSVTGGSTLDLVIATVHTSFASDDVILFGDKLNLSENTSFNSKEFVAANNPFTLVRGNIDDSDFYNWIVTEAADGAYYIFKDANGDLYSTESKMAVSSCTDGVVVGSYYCWEVCNYQLTPHQRVSEFADNVDGIEASLEALVGLTTNLAIIRDFYKDGYFNTLCLPISLDEAAVAAHFDLGVDCEIYEFVSAAVNGGTLDLYLNQVYAIEAGKPYLVRWDGIFFEPTIHFLYFEGVEIETSEGEAVGTGVQFVGSIGRTQLENGNHDYLFVGENNTLYWPDTNNKLKGFRAYFKVSGDVAPHGAPARMVIRKTPTGVEDVKSAAISAQKVLHDGKLIIVRDGVEYNAQGQIVK